MSEKEKQAIENLNKSTEKLTPAQMQRLSDIAYGMARWQRRPSRSPSRTSKLRKAEKSGKNRAGRRLNHAKTV